jgi:hypothetical protein
VGAQDRLPKELRLAGISAIEAADRFIREVYPPTMRVCDAAADRGERVRGRPIWLFAEILCIEQERIVGRDNTIIYEGRRLQLPQSPLRAHYVALDVAVLGLEDALSGSVKLRCAFGSDAAAGRGLWGSLPSFFSRAAASAAALAFASASSSAFASQNLVKRPCLSATQSGILSPRLAAPNALSSAASAAWSQPSTSVCNSASRCSCAHSSSPCAWMHSL